MFINAFQELEAQYGALVTSKIERERKRFYLCSLLHAWEHIFIRMAYLSPVGNLHQVLVLGVHHKSVGDAK